MPGINSGCDTIPGVQHALFQRANMGIGARTLFLCITDAKAGITGLQPATITRLPAGLRIEGCVIENDNP